MDKRIVISFTEREFRMNHPDANLAHLVRSRVQQFRELERGLYSDHAIPLTEAVTQTEGAD